MVSVNDALNDYRARASTTMAGPTDAGRSARHAVIPEGVYTYITNGREALDGPLTESHIYPAESAITITESECGFDWRWDVFERRSDTNIWCWINDDLTESQSTTDHIFFKVHDKRRDKGVNQSFCKKVFPLKKNAFSVHSFDFGQCGRFGANF